MATTTPAVNTANVSSFISGQNNNTFTALLLDSNVFELKGILRLAIILADSSLRELACNLVKQGIAICETTGARVLQWLRTCVGRWFTLAYTWLTRRKNARNCDDRDDDDQKKQMVVFLKLRKAFWQGLLSPRVLTDAPPRTRCCPPRRSNRSTASRRCASKHGTAFT